MAGGDGAVVAPVWAAGLPAVATTCPGGIVIVWDLIYKSIAGVANLAKTADEEVTAAVKLAAPVGSPNGLVFITAIKSVSAAPYAAANAVSKVGGTNGIFYCLFIY